MNPKGEKEILGIEGDVVSCLEIAAVRKDKERLTAACLSTGSCSSF